MVATAGTVEVRAGTYVVDGSVDCEEDGKVGIGAIVDG